MLFEPFRSPFSHSQSNGDITTHTEARRVHESLLAAVEKRCLIWMAKRLPARDQLGSPDRPGRRRDVGRRRVLLDRIRRPRCWSSIALLAVNWFGDSLDGTLARVRHHERPRYGFYVDHVLDVLCMLFMFAGLVLGGHMSPVIGGGFLLAYYLLMIEIALATHAVGVFRISFWKFGPTELRILLAIGSLRLMHSDFVTIAGAGLPAVRHRRCWWRSSALVVTFIVSASRQHPYAVSRRAVAGPNHARQADSRPGSGALLVEVSAL